MFFAPEDFIEWAKVVDDEVIDILPRFKITNEDFETNDWRVVEGNRYTIDETRFLIVDKYALKVFPDKVVRTFAAQPISTKARLRLAAIRKREDDSGN